MQFIQNVNHSIKKHQMLQFGDKVLIAVSGGADSLALLFCLNALKDAFGLRLHIAHLDHMLRTASYRDYLYVKGIARELGIFFHAKKINLRRIKRGSGEEVARNARIDFLIKTASSIGADKIALGHTKNDQAETVLMRIIRGSGLYGLSAILPKRDICGFTFIRPLIEVERRDVDSFLKKLRVKPVKDTTNFETKFFRNKIRLKLLPLLAKEYNPAIKESLSNLAQICSSDYELIEALAKKTLRDCVLKISRKKLILDFKKVLNLKKSLQRMVFRLAIEELSAARRRFTFSHWREIEDLILRRSNSSVVDLPHQISVSKLRNQIILSLRNP